MEFLRSALSFAWLEVKALQFYPVNGVLQVVQSFVNVGIWFFVSLFLQEYAQDRLDAYGGDFVAYVVVGVLFFQNSSAILNLPHQSLSTAFWDKRLEVYHARRYGLWAFLVGRFLWAFVYQSLVLVLILAAALNFTGIRLSPDAPLLVAALFYVVFVFTCFGIGLVGAGNFFTLEVKQGREPVAWLADVLARIFSGVYYPVAILPAALHGVAWLLPHTHALEGIRRVMIGGAGFADPLVARSFGVLLLFCALSLAGGIFLLSRAIDRAEAGNGVGMVV